MPARRAQPGLRGPPTSQTVPATSATATTPASAIRVPVRSRQPAASRQAAAATTAATQQAVMKSTQRCGVSVPVPRLCMIAAGQHRYASQCTRRQSLWPTCTRSRLVIVTAMSRSKATAPRPSQIGR